MLRAIRTPEGSEQTTSATGRRSGTPATSSSTPLSATAAAPGRRPPCCGAPREVAPHNSCSPRAFHRGERGEDPRSRRGTSSCALPPPDSRSHRYSPPPGRRIGRSRHDTRSG
ncbi:hypothetical protein SGL43_02628 [Streptomyces globisporus]|uniref:Uncharacterized protein n=1 Tax=Streptomyces globisporus TaxID=1908 RepID=A0ABN8V0Z1_STRGL|nr:hypothetical protein SGL43_02628 [Streptomyces globisporus]